MKKVFYILLFLLPASGIFGQVLYLNAVVTYAEEKWLIDNYQYRTGSGSVRPGIAVGAELEFPEGKTWSVVPGISYYQTGFSYSQSFIHDYDKYFFTNKQLAPVVFQYFSFDFLLSLNTFSIDK